MLGCDSSEGVWGSSIPVPPPCTATSRSRHRLVNMSWLPCSKCRSSRALKASMPQGRSADRRGRGQRGLYSGGGWRNRALDHVSQGGPDSIKATAPSRAKAKRGPKQAEERRLQLSALIAVSMPNKPVQHPENIARKGDASSRASLLLDGVQKRYAKQAFGAVHQRTEEEGPRAGHASCAFQNEQMVSEGHCA